MQLPLLRASCPAGCSSLSCLQGTSWGSTLGVILPIFSSDSSLTQGFSPGQGAGHGKQLRGAAGRQRGLKHAALSTGDRPALDRGCDWGPEPSQDAAIHGPEQPSGEKVAGLGQRTLPVRATKRTVLHLGHVFGVTPPSAAARGRVVQLHRAAEAFSTALGAPRASRGCSGQRAALAGPGASGGAVPAPRCSCGMRQLAPLWAGFSFRAQPQKTGSQTQRGPGAVIY